MKYGLLPNTSQQRCVQYEKWALTSDGTVAKGISDLQITVERHPGISRYIKNENWQPPKYDNSSSPINKSREQYSRVFLNFFSLWVEVLDYYPITVFWVDYHCHCRWLAFYRSSKKHLWYCNPVSEQFQAFYIPFWKGAVQFVINTFFKFQAEDPDIARNLFAVTDGNSRTKYDALGRNV